MGRARPGKWRELPNTPPGELPPGEEIVAVTSHRTAPNGLARFYVATNRNLYEFEPRGAGLEGGRLMKVPLHIIEKES